MSGSGQPLNEHVRFPTLNMFVLTDSGIEKADAKASRVDPEARSVGGGQGEFDLPERTGTLAGGLRYISCRRVSTRTSIEIRCEVESLLARGGDNSLDY